MIVILITIVIINNYKNFSAFWQIHFIFFKIWLSGVVMVKRARTRCRVDGLYFIDKKQTRGINWEPKKSGNEGVQVGQNN